MSGGNKREREERALDALLVSALRRDDIEGADVDPKRLPTLTAEEKAAMNSLGTDFVKRLLQNERPLPPQIIEEEQETEGEQEQDEAALAGSGASSWLNRAEEIDAETAEELERRKREILAWFKPG